MEENNMNSPEYTPDEYRVPYDIVPLPSQGLLYKNGKNSVTVEYLTAMDETILTSPNIIANNKVVDTLLKRKIKDLGFDPSELLEGDRVAILIFLRVSAFGNEYSQIIYNDKTQKYEEGIVDLSSLKAKMLDVKPDENGWFDFVLPDSGKEVKFRLLSAKDEDEIDIQDEEQMKRNNSEESMKIIYRLERQIMSFDGITDKMKIRNLIKNPKYFSIKDSRKLRDYIKSIEPGLDMNTVARTRGGESVPCFLRFNASFFFPEL